MNAKSFHLSVQGASHIRKNKECQDASYNYQDEICTIAIVCDGHGGDDYFRSAVGSKIGCEVAGKNIQSFFHGIDKDTFFSAPDMHLKNLEASIINDWNESIYAYHSTHPFSEDELAGVSGKVRKKYTEDGRIESAYGTTMIAVAMSKDYWFGIHIGDGKCVAINPEGEFKQPIPWDQKCFLNVTTSICDSDAIERFRHFYSEKLPAAVFVGSDGIDDCFKNNEQLHNLYKTVLYSFATMEFEDACVGLEDYLPRLSAKGSGDDVSIAALLDLDLIPELSIVKEFDREKEKARVEENARKEAEKNEVERKRVEEEHAKFQRENNIKAQGAVKKKSQKFCENCGEKLVTDAKFCSNCGARISNIGADSTASTQDDGIQAIKICSFESNPKQNEDLARYKEESTIDIMDGNDVEVVSDVNEDQAHTDSKNEVSSSSVEFGGITLDAEIEQPDSRRSEELDNHELTDQSDEQVISVREDVVENTNETTDKLSSEEEI